MQSTRLVRANRNVTLFTGITVDGWTPSVPPCCRGGEARQLVPGNEMGSIPSDGLHHMSCRCGGSGSPQNAIGTDLCFIRYCYTLKGKGTVSWWAAAGVDGQEDDSNEVGKAGERKWKLYWSKFILDQSDAPVAAASLPKARSYSSHARPDDWQFEWSATCILSYLTSDGDGKHRSPFGRL